MKIIVTKFKRKQVCEAGGKKSARDKRLGVIIMITAAALFVLLAVLIFRPLMTLVSNPEEMRAFVRLQGPFGWIAFLGIQILQGLLPIPLELTTVAAGYIFGRVQGCALTICSTVISTTAIFYCTKIFGRSLVDLFFPPDRQRKVKYIRDEKVRDTVTLVVFLIPGTPKRLFVFTAGLVPQKFSKFLAISTVARIPALLACSFGGNALGSGNYTQAVVIFIVTGAVSVAGLLFYQFVMKLRNKKEKNLRN